MSEVTHTPRPLSGFPEWLPEVRRIELQWLDDIRRTFESYGFCSIETPAVEDLRALVAKGETDKEIYALTRLQAADDEKGDGRLALHYDLTVPFARYVAQHYNDLVFPFKRYQIQKVWRGERPQEGRFREFYQCDIDVINNDQLPLHFDAEIPAIIHEIACTLDIGAFSIGVSNRKILEGFYQGLGIENIAAAIRIADKLDKIGPLGLRKQLEETQGLSPEVAQRCLALAQIRTPSIEFAERVRALGVRSPLLDEGISELAFVFEYLRNVGIADVVADMSIARGFDYYTGTVYEGKSLEFPKLGALFSGGRYDDLAGSFINRHLPGVGISIGLTRIFSKLVATGKIPAASKCPTDVLVVLPNEERRHVAIMAAQTLRSKGLNVETYHAAAKLQNQLRYASRKGIPFVWFPPFEEGQPHEVKNLATQEQVVADIETWTCRSTK